VCACGVNRQPTFLLAIMFKLVLVVALAAYVSAQASSSAFGSELSNLDFSSIIGGPLKAVVQAQAQAAKETATFINGVGFTEVNTTNGKVKTVRTVEFNYFSTDNNGSDVSKSMSVPFLYLIPIPFIQVDSVSIDFNVKLNSVAEVQTQTTTTSQFNENQWSAAWGWGWVAVKSFSGSVSKQSQTKSTSKVTKEYSLQISVQASQAALPGGMERLLDLFESIVRQDADPITQ